MDTQALTLEPIVIRYDGMDAERHQIDLAEFGKSAQGLAKILAVVGEFAITRNYDEKRRKLTCRVVTNETKANCYSVQAFIEVLEQSPLLTGVAAAVVSNVVTGVLGWLWGRWVGRNDKEMEALREVAIAAIKEAGTRDQAQINRLLDTIERMADGLKQQARLAVSPIDNTCNTIKFGYKNEYFTEINSADKAAINSENFSITDEATYQLAITELDMQKLTCKVSLIEDFSKRYNADIVDPQIELPNNKYVLAMAQKAVVKVRAKKRIFTDAESKQEKIKDFVISDIE